MNILLIEAASTDLPLFTAYLRRKLSCRISHAESIEEALQRLVEQNGSVDFAIVTADTNPHLALKYIQMIRDFAEGAGIRHPQSVLLSWTPLSERNSVCLRKCRALGIRYLLRRYPEQVAEEIRQMAQEGVLPNGTTVRVVRSQCHVRFHLIGSGQEVEWRLGPKLLELLSYFANHRHSRAHTTAMIAEATGIRRNWVRIYMDRLRKAFDETKQEVGLTSYGKDVFRTTLEPGGFLHHVSINFIG